MGFIFGNCRTKKFKYFEHGQNFYHVKNYLSTFKKFFNQSKFFDITDVQGKRSAKEFKRIISNANDVK